jgi:hypothetical protein
MSLILLLFVILLLCGGGFGHYRGQAWGGASLGLGTVLLIVLLVLIL